MPVLASAAHRRSEVGRAPRTRQDLPRAAAHLPLLSAALAFAVGARILVGAFGPDVLAADRPLLFWFGLVCCVAAVGTHGLRRGTRAWERVGGLAALGAVMYLPYYLRSPANALFSDDLYHRQVVQQIDELGTTNVHPTLYPIPGEFPGLEQATLALHGMTGLGLGTLERLVPLAAHTSMPVVAYVLARGVGLPSRTAFLAALIFVGNKAFFFFHSAFAYETLGILLVMTTLALIAHAARDGSPVRRYAVPVLVALSATVITHHVSSYLLIAFLTLIAGFAVVTRSQHRRIAVALPAIAVGLAAAWLLLRATAASTYLSNGIHARLTTIVNAITNEGSGTRKLFAQSTLPTSERLLGYVATLTVLVLCVLGAYAVFRLRRRRPFGPLTYAFLVFGPLLWIVSAPAIVTPGAELAYRSWPFLFLGVSMFGAIALRRVEQRMRHGAPVLAHGVMIGVVTLVIAGGVVIGDNDAGRFPRPAQTAAGPEDVTGDSIAAAQWFERRAGRYNRFVADNGSQLVFATFGFQEALAYGNWLPFVAPSTPKIPGRLDDLGVKYVVIDRRVTVLPPRYGYYFGQEELYSAGLAFSGRAFPRRLIDRFDDVPTLDRIYDNGNIVIYGPTKAGI
ncbi:MAG TPA: hypothetical protein VK501_18560 [Baekduia sp.]|uniref:hypothetical protein n=1 Tax=Baekduia sp. TaxID=2600305 RepID=UPI002C30DB7B|nr:hypothetical protein [Baekduia sp.]HMJ35913.1 hypothetical protein [Baekduia sp.]